MDTIEAQLAAVTAERDALLQKHRKVCRACAMLFPEQPPFAEVPIVRIGDKSAPYRLNDPTQIFTDFLAEHSNKPTP